MPETRQHTIHKKRKTLLWNATSDRNVKKQWHHHNNSEETTDTPTRQVSLALRSSTCAARWLGQIHRTHLWRSTSAGTWTKNTEWIHQSTCRMPSVVRCRMPRVPAAWMPIVSRTRMPSVVRCRMPRVPITQPANTAGFKKINLSWRKRTETQRRMPVKTIHVLMDLFL